MDLGALVTVLVGSITLGLLVEAARAAIWAMAFVVIFKRFWR